MRILKTTFLVLLLFLALMLGVYAGKEGRFWDRAFKSPPTIRANFFPRESSFALMEIEVASISSSRAQAINIIEQRSGQLMNVHLSNQGKRGQKVFLSFKVLDVYLKENIDLFKQIGEVKKLSITYRNMDNTTALKNQLESIKKEEGALHQLYARVKNVDEIVKIEKEISRLRREQAVVLKQLSQGLEYEKYAGIELVLVEKPRANPVYKMSAIIKESFESAKISLLLISGWVIAALVFLAVFLPAIILVGLVFWLLFFLVRRWRKKERYKI